VKVNDDVFVRPNELWYFLWLECLKRNGDYTSYVDARRNDRNYHTGFIGYTETKLRHSEIDIRALHKDFGDLAGLYSLDTMRNWLRKREHLFAVEWTDYTSSKHCTELKASMRKAIAKPVSENEVLLRHAIRPTKALMLADFERFLDRQHRDWLKQMPKPKYAFNSQMRLNYAIFDNIARALAVYDVRQSVYEETSKPDTYGTMARNVLSEDFIVEGCFDWSGDIDRSNARTYTFEGKSIKTVVSELKRLNVLASRLIDNSLYPVFNSKSNSGNK